MAGEDKNALERYNKWIDRIEKRVDAFMGAADPEGEEELAAINWHVEQLNIKYLGLMATFLERRQLFAGSSRDDLLEELKAFIETGKTSSELLKEIYKTDES